MRRFLDQISRARFYRFHKKDPVLRRSMTSSVHQTTMLGTRDPPPLSKYFSARSRRPPGRLLWLWRWQSEPRAGAAEAWKFACPPCMFHPAAGRINLANAVSRFCPSVRPFVYRTREGGPAVLDDGIAASCTGSVAAKSGPRNSCSGKTDRTLDSIFV